MKGTDWITDFIFSLCADSCQYIYHWTFCEYELYEILSLNLQPHIRLVFHGNKLNLWILCAWCYIRTSNYIMNPLKLEDCALNQTFGPLSHSAWFLHCFCWNCKIKCVLGVELWWARSVLYKKNPNASKLCFCQRLRKDLICFWRKGWFNVTTMTFFQ